VTAAARPEPFLAALSVNELALVEQSGFRPLGLVLGCSVYPVGDVEGRTDAGQLEVVTEALYAARQRAMGRLETEADAAGADGVIGLRFTLDTTEVDGLVHFTVLGTSLRADRPPRTGTWRNARGLPFTATLDGQDFWTLLRSGYAPVGVVVGASSYPGRGSLPERWVRTRSTSAEAVPLTEAVYAARDRAVARLRAEAEELAADGVVDLRFTGLPELDRTVAAQMLAIGTAVRTLGGTDRLPAPTPVLPMTDG